MIYICDCQQVPHTAWCATQQRVPSGHANAQARIAECVREIEILCDTFGYDPAEWLVDVEERQAQPEAPKAVDVSWCRPNDATVLMCTNVPSADFVNRLIAAVRNYGSVTITSAAYTSPQPSSEPYHNADAGLYGPEYQAQPSNDARTIREAWLHAYTSLGCDHANAEKMVAAEIAAYTLPQPSRSTVMGGMVSTPGARSGVDTDKRHHQSLPLLQKKGKE